MHVPSGTKSGGFALSLKRAVRRFMAKGVDSEQMRTVHQLTFACWSNDTIRYMLSEKNCAYYELGLYLMSVRIGWCCCKEISVLAAVEYEKKGDEFLVVESAIVVLVELCE